LLAGDALSAIARGDIPVIIDGQVRRAPRSPAPGTENGEPWPRAAGIAPEVAGELP